MSTLKFYPNETQELLLKTILFDGETSKKSWQQWKNLIDFDRLDYDTCCLIPSLYKTLIKHQITSKYMPLMKGLARKFWYKNQLLYAQLTRLNNSFQSEKISLIAIRGTAINLAYYKNDLVRPVEEIDLLLINTSQIDKFNKLLINRKWQKIPDSPITETIRFLHPPTSVKLDLHKYILQTGLENDSFKMSCLLEKEKKLLVNTQTIFLKENTLKILSPEVQLLQVLMQGTNPNFVSPYRWIMDIHQIIKSTPSFNWLSFSENVKRFEQKKIVLPMLNYLRSCYAIDVPEFVFDLSLINEFGTVQF